MMPLPNRRISSTRAYSTLLVVRVELAEQQSTADEAVGDEETPRRHRPVQHPEPAATAKPLFQRCWWPTAAMPAESWLMLESPEPVDTGMVAGTARTSV